MAREHNIIADRQLKFMSLATNLSSVDKIGLKVKPTDGNGGYAWGSWCVPNMQVLFVKLYLESRNWDVVFVFTSRFAAVLLESEHKNTEIKGFLWDFHANFECLSPCFAWLQAVCFLKECRQTVLTSSFRRSKVVVSTAVVCKKRWTEIEVWRNFSMNW